MADPSAHASRIEHLPDAEEASAWVGSRVDEIDGVAVGRIESLLVDADDGSPTWFVIRRGRLGHRSAIPVQFVAPGVGHVWTPFDREMIQGAPEVPRDGGLGRELERELADHYGIPAAGATASVPEAAVADEPEDDDGPPPSV
jgi:PRC-barrel domain protein